MQFPFKRSFGFIAGPVARRFAATGLFCVLGFLSVQAQVRPGNDRIPDFREIDQAEGARRMADFRNQRLEGDFCFDFKLEHLPRQGKGTVYNGRMWGSWNAKGPVTRVKLSIPEALRASLGYDALHLIVQNGRAAQAWMREGGDGDFRELRGAARFEPLLPGMNYSVFDLQMPFIYWDDFVYEGPDRALGRAAQSFLMYPPDSGEATGAGISAVSVTLDESYNALLRVDVIGLEGREVSSFRIRKFKRVQDQWIVRTIDLFDPESRSRTRFEVEAAATGIDLDAGIFNPDTGVELPVLADSVFEDL